MTGGRLLSESALRRVPVAVVILTFNEESNLPAAIASVRGWASEIFVVDSFSTDRTVDLALAHREDGVRVVQHAFENYSAQWNWALAELPIRSAWILKLDADERATPEFRDEVDGVLAGATPDLDGIYFRRRIVFMGRALAWGGTAGYDLRLWRAGRGRFDGREVNEHLIVPGQTARLRSHVEHHDTKTMSEWLDKHNRYSSLEALQLIGEGRGAGVEPRLFGRPDERRQWLRRLFFANPFAFLSSAGLFAYHYLGRLGLLDGTRGFQVALLRALFFYLVHLKVLEHRRTGKLPTVTWPARGAPHPGLPAGAPGRAPAPAADPPGSARS